jgi:hypothetical protein
MKPQKARGNQRQSEAIRGHQLLVIQRPTETIRCNQAAPQTKSDEIRRNQTQSGAIRRNQTQSACPEHCVSVFSCFGRAARACVLCFCVLSRHNGPVFCVFVFWQTPLKTQGGVKEFSVLVLGVGSGVRVAIRGVVTSVTAAYGVDGSGWL